MPNLATRWWFYSHVDLVPVRILYPPELETFIGAPANPAMVPLVFAFVGPPAKPALAPQEQLEFVGPGII